MGDLHPGESFSAFATGCELSTAWERGGIYILAQFYAQQENMDIPKTPTEIARFVKERIGFPEHVDTIAEWVRDSELAEEEKEYVAPKETRSARCIITSPH